MGSSPRSPTTSWDGGIEPAQTRCNFGIALDRAEPWGGGRIEGRVEPQRDPTSATDRGQPALRSLPGSTSRRSSSARSASAASHLLGPATDARRAHLARRARLVGGRRARQPRGELAALRVRHPRRAPAGLRGNVQRRFASASWRSGPDASVTRSCRSRCSSASRSRSRVSGSRRPRSARGGCSSTDPSEKDGAVGGCRVRYEPRQAARPSPSRERRASRSFVAACPDEVRIIALSARLSLALPSPRRSRGVLATRGRRGRGGLPDHELPPIRLPRVRVDGGSSGISLPRGAGWPGVTDDPVEPRVDDQKCGREQADVQILRLEGVDPQVGAR